MKIIYLTKKAFYEKYFNYFFFTWYYKFILAKANLLYIKSKKAII